MKFNWCSWYITYNDSSVHRVPLAPRARQPSHKFTAAIPKNSKVHATSLYSCDRDTARDCVLYRYLISYAHLLSSPLIIHAHVLSQANYPVVTSLQASTTIPKHPHGCSSHRSP